MQKKVINIVRKLIFNDSDAETINDPDTLKGISFIHLNIRSYFSKKDEIMIEFDKYDIVCFTETWLTESDCAVQREFVPPGYRFLHQPKGVRIQY